MFSKILSVVANSKFLFSSDIFSSHMLNALYHLRIEENKINPSFHLPRGLSLFPPPPYALYCDAVIFIIYTVGL